MIKSRGCEELTYRKVIDTCYCDISNLSDLLGKLVNSYRTLVGAADELNKIALSGKSEINRALDRVEDLGYVVDEVIKALDSSVCNYSTYCRVKASAMKPHIVEKHISSEIQSEFTAE
ncbi:MAG: hypothetical protein RSB70_02255 [Clostridium sp.]